MRDREKMFEELEAYLDGELGPEAVEAVETWLEAEVEARAWLLRSLRLRNVLGAEFRTTLEAAPDPPRGLEESMKEELSSEKEPRLGTEGSPPKGGRRSGPRLMAVVGTAALVLLSAGAVLFYPRPQVIASPVVSLHRAADNYERLADAELWIRIESQAIQALEGLFGGGGKSEGSDPSDGDSETGDDEGRDSEESQSWFDLAPMRLLVQGRNRVLYQKVSDLNAPLDVFLEAGGFDGEEFWSYEMGSDKVVVAPNDGSGLDISLDLEGGVRFEAEDLDFMRFLSWGFLRDLQEANDHFEIRELTWPADDRAQRRVFRLERLKKGEGSQLIWGGATVTLDATEDIIERMVLDLSLGPVSLLSVTVEVAATNQGLAPEFFEFEAHVPEGIRVETSSPESSASDGEDSSDED